MKWRLLLAVAAFGLTSRAQAPSDALAEAHHRPILRNDLVRVFAVSIPTGEEAHVRYRHNFLTVTIRGSRMAMWIDGTTPALTFPIGAGDTRFFLGGAPFGMRNDGKDEFKNITVEFLDPRVTHYGFQYNRNEGPQWDYGSSALGPPVDAHSGFVHALPLQKAVVRDVRLLPGEQLVPPEQKTKELLIAVTDVSLTFAADRELRHPSGDVAWMEGRTSSLINQGKDSARFVVVELR